MTVTYILGLTSIVIFYLFMVSPHETKSSNIFTLTSLTSKQNVYQRLWTFFYFSMKKNTFINIF